jgi:hypothetical protein
LILIGPRIWRIDADPYEKAEYPRLDAEESFLQGNAGRFINNNEKGWPAVITLLSYQLSFLTSFLFHSIIVQHLHCLGNPPQKTTSMPMQMQILGPIRIKRKLHPKTCNGIGIYFSI